MIITIIITVIIVIIVLIVIRVIIVIIVIMIYKGYKKITPFVCIIYPTFIHLWIQYPRPHSKYPEKIVHNTIHPHVHGLVYKQCQTSDCSL